MTDPLVAPVVDAPAPTGAWRDAVVREVDHVGARTVRLRLDVPDRIDHVPGQHYVIRLTAPDGYVAQRSYSIASAPDDPLLELLIERLDDGEVSPFLADEVRAGDQLRVRGPMGGWFVWRGNTSALGVAGGSGVVPFISMLRHAVHLGVPDQLRLVVSARSASALPYARELAEFGAVIAFTREARAGGRPVGRLTVDDIAGLIPGSDADYFICGSAPFADAASTLLMAAGAPEARIRVERFGPSG